MKWQLIRALQMFVEHVVLKHEGMIPYLRRLHMVTTVTIIVYLSATLSEFFHLLLQHLRNDADFLKASAVERVRRHLNMMANEFKKYARLQDITLL